MPDWTTLSVRGQEILRTAATSASQGYSTVEIARGFGISKRLICGLLDKLQDELRRL
jgi:DNA-binding CsgD family transcriptional regulator